MNGHDAIPRQQHGYYTIDCSCGRYEPTVWRKRNAGLTDSDDALPWAVWFRHTREP